MPKTKPPLSAREVFARNVRRARRMKDLSQESLALEAGVTRAFLSRVEQGTTNASINSLDAIAKAVKVPLRDLVDPEKFTDVDDAT